MLYVPAKLQYQQSYKYWQIGYFYWNLPFLLSHLAAAIQVRYRYENCSLSVYWHQYHTGTCMYTTSLFLFSMYLMQYVPVVKAIMQIIQFIQCTSAVQVPVYTYQYFTSTVLHVLYEYRYSQPLTVRAHRCRYTAPVLYGICTVRVTTVCKKHSVQSPWRYGRS